MLQVWDVAERDSEVLLLGRTDKGTTACVRVRDVPVTVLMDCVNTERMSPRELGEQLNDYLCDWVINRKWCSRTKCSCGNNGGEIMALNTGPCTEQLRNQLASGQLPVLRSALVERKSTVGFSRTTKPMFEFTLSEAAYSSAAVRFLYQKIDKLGWRDKAEVYGGLTNMADAFLYASDTLDTQATQKACADGIMVFTWVSCIGDPLPPDVARISTCQHESITSFSDLRIEHSKNDEYGYVMCSYDIETMTDGYEFSDATKDPVLVIGVVFFLPDNTTKEFALTWGDGDINMEDPLMVNTEVRVYPNESAMLLGFQELIQEESPDIMIGYNNFAFDDKYLEDRADLVLVNPADRTKFAQRSRVSDRQSRSYLVNRSTKGGGDRELYLHDNPGVLCLDVMRMAKVQLTELAQHTLNDVATKVLKAQKHDMPATEIATCFYGNADQKAKLLAYCVQDCRLPGRILKELYWVRGLCEEARFFGLVPRQITTLGKQAQLTRCTARFTTPLGMVIPKHRRNGDLNGHQFKKRNIIERTFDEAPAADEEDADLLYIPMYRKIPFKILPEHESEMKAKPEATHKQRTLNEFWDDCLPPVPKAPPKKKKKNAREAKYPGAEVFDTENGLHKTPTAVGDFNSLYPSIMRAHNLGSDSLIGTEEDAIRMGLQPDEYEVSVVKYCFVRTHVWKCVFNRMAEYAIEERKKTKKLMKNAATPEIWRALDARQLAQKLGANSLYGAQGGVTSNLTCIYAAYAITTYGRTYINAVKNFVENEGPKLPGFEGSKIKVIAGDTDSVFVRINNDAAWMHDGVLDIPKAMELCAFLFQKVNEANMFPPPLFMEFEKMFEYLAINGKKHYAGLKHEPGAKQPKIMVRGLANVRKDALPYMKTTYERMMDMVLKERRSKQEIREYIRSRVLGFYSGDIPLEEITIRQKLRRLEYEHPEQLAHLMVWRMWKERRPGDCPRVGETIPYILVDAVDPETGKTATNVSLRARPVWMVTNGEFSPDYLFTMTKKFQTPITDFLLMIFTQDELDQIFAPPPNSTGQRLREQGISRLKRQRAAMRTFFQTKFAKPEEIEDILLSKQ